MNKSCKNKCEKVIPKELIGQIYLEPKYDPAFKELFDNEDALRDFLDGVLQLKGKDKIKKISFHFDEALYSRGQKVIFDILATTGSGRFLDIEMQRAKHDFFIDRAVLYKAFLIIKGKRELIQSSESRKLSKEEKKRRHYELPETISIWICNFNLPKVSGEYLDEWLLYSRRSMEKGRPISIFPKNRYIIISLPNFRKTENEVTNSLDAWLYLMNHASECRKLPDFGKNVIKDALERIKVENANDELLKAQVKNMVTKAELDTIMASASIKAQKRGMNQGLKQGMQQGRVEERIRLAKGFRDNGIPLDVISHQTGFSVEEIEAL